MSQTEHEMTAMKITLSSLPKAVKLVDRLRNEKVADLIGQVVVQHYITDYNNSPVTVYTEQQFNKLFYWIGYPKSGKFTKIRDLRKDMQHA